MLILKTFSTRYKNIQTVVKENEIKCTLSQIVVGIRADIFNQRIPINVGRIKKFNRLNLSLVYNLETNQSIPSPNRLLK
jgi:hypothetical protein